MIDHRLTHIVLQTKYLADVPRAQCLRGTARLRRYHRRNLLQTGRRVRTPYRVSIVGRHPVLVQKQRCVRKGGQRVRRRTGNPAVLSDVAVQHQTVRIDLLGKRGGCGLQKQPRHGIHIARGLNRGQLHIHGRDRVQLDLYRFLHKILRLNPRRTRKRLRLQTDRTLYQYRVPLLHTAVVAVVPVDQTRKDQIVT